VDYILSIAIILAIYVILASSLNVVLGHGGLLSLCHAGFYAIGAYTAALLGTGLGLKFLATVACAGFVAAIIAEDRTALERRLCSTRSPSSHHRIRAACSLAMSN
jgi:ABC-type branched-subunit amino acid transport system permease subunit